MEDILNKDIFDDNVLLTLSPDYKPSNVLLRMQMRSTMVKDTHNHRIFNNRSDCLRQNMKRNNDNYKINKEVVKLKNEFQNKNSKNQTILKNCRIENMKLKPLAVYNDDIFEYTSIVKNLNRPFEGFDASELVLQNDTKFKLKNKIRTVKSIETSENHTDKEYFQVIKEPCFDVISVDCKMLTPNFNNEEVPQSQSIIINEEEVISHDTIIDNMKEDIVEEYVVKNSKHGNELQELLIMLALSPKVTNSTNVWPGSTDNELTEKNKGIENAEIIEAITDTENKLSTPAGNPIKTELTDILNITTLKKKLCDDREEYLAKKYTEMWKKYMKNKKSTLLQKRQDTLNSFFDKLAKKKLERNRSEKCKESVRDFNTYQHRYKMQKHIIALQKAKLNEQNRLIEELKYNKIVEASKQSVDSMREEVRKTYYEIDKHLKPKIKCLTNELKIQDIEEPSLVLHCLKVPQFLQRMEKRAREREEKHAMIRERRRQIEEERIRVKQQAEIAKAEMDKEEKQERMRELREKRKRDKIEGIRKKHYAERMRALLVMAELHYEKSLKLKYGIHPLKILVEKKRVNIEKAKLNYKCQLQKNVFLNWMWYTEDMWYERNFKAEDFYRKKMLRKLFTAFKQNHYDLVLKKQVADDYYDLYVTQMVFRKLRENINIAKKENEAKMHTATMYHKSNLLFKILTCWSTLPAINALQREQEAKKARWRKTVLQVVPDYKPPDD